MNLAQLGGLADAAPQPTSINRAAPERPHHAARQPRGRGGRFRRLTLRDLGKEPVQPDENPVEGQDFSYPAGFRPGQVQDAPMNLDAERGEQAARMQRTLGGDAPYLTDIVRGMRPGQLNARSPRGDINLPNDAEETKTDDRGNALYRRRRRRNTLGAVGASR